jgi:hypothetical protein
MIEPLELREHPEHLEERFADSYGALTTIKLRF